MKYIYLGDRLTTQEFKNKTCVAINNQKIKACFKWQKIKKKVRKI